MKFIENLVVVLIVVFAFVSISFYNTKKTNTEDDIKQLLELVNGNIKTNERETEYYNEYMPATIKYASKDHILKRLITNDDLIYKMIRYLTKFNNSYFVTMAEMYPAQSNEEIYSFGIIAYGKSMKKICKEESKYLLFNYQHCENQPVKYNFEPIFNVCMMGGSINDDLYVTEIPNVYNPSKSNDVNLKLSIRLQYQRLVLNGDTGIQIDTVREWIDNEIAADIQLRFKKFNNLRCLYNS